MKAGSWPLGKSVFALPQLPVSQCDWQPYLTNVPKNMPSVAIKSHGLPLSNSMMPQPMKKANNVKAAMASVNFIGRNFINSPVPCKPRAFDRRRAEFKLN